MNIGKLTRVTLSQDVKYKGNTKNSGSQLYIPVTLASEWISKGIATGNLNEQIETLGDIADITGTIQTDLNSQKATLANIGDSMPKMNMCRSLKATFNTWEKAIESGSATVVFIGDSRLTYGPNAISKSESNADKIRTMLLNKYPGVNITFKNYAIAGTTMHEWNQNKTISAVEKTWIDHLKDASADLVIWNHGMNHTSYAQSKNIKYTLKAILDYIDANFTKKPSMVFATTPQPVRNGMYSKEESQDSRDIAAHTVRWYGLERGAYIADVNRLYHILRDGYDPLVTYLDGNPLALDITSTSTGNNTDGFTIKNTTDIITINTPKLSNFRLKFTAKFSTDSPAGGECLRVLYGSTSIANAIQIFPRTSDALCKIRSYGNNPDSSQWGAIATASWDNFATSNRLGTVSTAPFHDDTDRVFIVERANNVLKVYVDDALVLYDENIQINNAADIIQFKKESGNTGTYTVKNITLYEFKNKAYPKLLTDEQIWGQYVDGDTTTKQPYGGNGINHESTIGINRIGLPIWKELIDDMPGIQAGVVKNYTGTITLEQIAAGATLVPAVPGYSIKPLRYFILSTGDFSSGGGTNMLIQDNAATPVVVTTVAKAALTDGAKISSGATIANVTDGAGMLSALTVGKALTVSGASFSGGTSVTISIDYMLV